MSRSFLVEIGAKSASYPIIIGEKILSQISQHINLRKYTQIVIFTDENVAKYWLDGLTKIISTAQVHTVILSPGEKYKNLSTVEFCWKKLANFGFDRHGLLIALGGGVVGDLVGFVASTYMRGVDFVQIPTTVMAAADSSVGGKTGFDFLGQKNNIGTFCQPKLVMVDTQTFVSLPEREYRQGFAEIIKAGLVADHHLFEFLSKASLPKAHSSQLLFLLENSLNIKKNIVQKDERETTGERKLLNFGHTFGHAIELLSWELDIGLLHGEAVAIGMILESHLSQAKGYLSAVDVNYITNTIKNFGLPVDLSHFQNKISKTDLITRLLDLIRVDKKNVGSEIRWTLLKTIGQGRADEVLEDQIILDNLQRLVVD